MIDATDRSSKLEQLIEGAIRPYTTRESRADRRAAASSAVKVIELQIRAWMQAERRDLVEQGRALADYNRTLEEKLAEQRKHYEGVAAYHRSELQWWRDVCDAMQTELQQIRRPWWARILRLGANR